ncbi:hypothetical protein [Sinomicrobium sp. M5D2P17]
MTTAFPVLKPTGNFVIPWGGEKFISNYYGIYFKTQMATIFGFSIDRNTAIFAEGPIYNFHLCFAFLLEFFLKEKDHRNRKKLIVLLLAMLSTFTTTGQLFLAGFVGVLFVFNKTRNKFLVLLKVVSFPILLVVILNLFLNIISEKQSSDSYATREVRIYESIQDWTRNPMLGVGYGKTGEGSSNSLFTILSDGGLLLLSVYIVPFLFVPLFLFLRYKNTSYLYMSILFFSVFVITITMYTILILSFISFGMYVLIDKTKNRKYYLNMDNAS